MFHDLTNLVRKKLPYLIYLWNHLIELNIDTVIQPISFYILNSGNINRFSIEIKS